MIDQGKAPRKMRKAAEAIVCRTEGKVEEDLVIANDAAHADGGFTRGGATTTAIIAWCHSVLRMSESCVARGPG